MGLGFVPDLFFLAVLAVVAGVPVAIVLFAALVRRRAKQFGYASTGAYLRAAPRSDAEKRDAADLVLRGLVFCMIGLHLLAVRPGGAHPALLWRAQAAVYVDGVGPR